MSLRSKVIRLAHEKPELRGKLLPLLVEDGVKTAVKAVTIEGTRYTWKRANKAPKGRSGWGSPPDQFRAWRLEDSKGNLIVQILHNRYIPPFQSEPSEPPAWKVMLRFTSHPEEMAKNGTYTQFFLKARFPSENGDEEGIEEAMAASVRAWEKLKRERDEKLAKSTSSQS